MPTSRPIRSRPRAADALLLPHHAPSAALRPVHEAIVTCERCPRLRRYCAEIARVKRAAFRNETYWGRPVPGFGDPDARVLVVGLAPAAHGGNRTGRVFTGDGAGGSGDFLMAAMHAAGFANQPTSRHPGDGLQLIDAFIAAAVRCAPPDNKPTPEEFARCASHLSAEWDALPNVRVVVALGKLAYDACWKELAARGERAAEAETRVRAWHLTDTGVGHVGRLRLPSQPPEHAHGEIDRADAGCGLRDGAAPG